MSDTKKEIALSPCPLCGDKMMLRFDVDGQIGPDSRVEHYDTTADCLLASMSLSARTWNHRVYPSFGGVGVLPEGCPSVMMFGNFDDARFTHDLADGYFHERNDECEMAECTPVEIHPAGTRERLAAQPRVTEPRIYTKDDIHEAPEGEYRCKYGDKWSQNGTRPKWDIVKEIEAAQIRIRDGKKPAVDLPTAYRRPIPQPESVTA